MSVRVRQHVNPLGLGFTEFRGRRPVLEHGREVELEIGCAEAQFLFERAALEPDHIYIGLEIREALVAMVNGEAQAQRAPLQVIFCNANKHLRAIFPANSVARVFLNFPDPWFKRRHHNRRMIDEQLAVDIHHVLASNGELFFQSDVWDLALGALDVFERLDERYHNRAGAWSFWRGGNPYGARSWREASCEESGRPIWRLLYARLP